MKSLLLLDSSDETLYFEVESDSASGVTYDVMYDVDHHWLCTCPHYYFRKVFCKHMAACAEMMGIKDTMVYAEMVT